MIAFVTSSGVASPHPGRLLAPILVFIVAFWMAGPFRDFVMSVDLPVMAGIQAWRFGD